MRGIRTNEVRCNLAVEEEYGLNDNEVTMTMTMTLREVQHPSMKAWPYRRECREHDPAKKESVALMRLALLARCAQTQC